MDQELEIERKSPEEISLDVEAWAESSCDPLLWASKAETNIEIAELLYKNYKDGIKYRGHIMMIYGLALECYLKALSVKNGMIPLEKDRMGLNGTFTSHNLLYFYNFCFKNIDIEIKKCLNKLERGIRSGKYPFEKNPASDAYDDDIDKTIVFTKDLIEKITKNLKKILMNISKTDYILFRECPKNVWYKIHKPDIYYKDELSDFEKHIIETGNEVELVARKLYPGAVLVEGRDEAARKLTEELITKKQAAILQPVIVSATRGSTSGGKDGFMAAVDILEYNQATESFDITEIKASNEADKKRHYYDLAFQVNLLKRCGLKVGKINLMHLNPEYTRFGKLDIKALFATDDVTLEISELNEEVNLEMEQALKYLSSETEPPGSCSCLYKGRSNHCTTFHHSNPAVPKYSVHDISRIGLSKKKLAELIDGSHFDLREVPEEMELSIPQKNQISAYIHDHIIMDKGGIREELKNLVYPIYFIDYETFPSAVPMFDGFSPYQQIPFQYSLFILDAPGAELKHFEFLHDAQSDPSAAFVESMQSQIGKVGSIIVWSKKFECTINKQIAERVPEAVGFIEDINNRTYDLMDVFTKQHYVHKDFKGSTSIKKVQPVLAPELSYKDLTIQEGGTAASSWIKLISPVPTNKELSSRGASPRGDLTIDKVQLRKDMLAYCKLDTFAMVRILEELEKMIK